MHINDGINFIKKWYKFRFDMCSKYPEDCKQCPLYESTDVWSANESVDNCKYDFGAEYAEDIINLMNNKNRQEGL